MWARLVFCFLVIAAAGAEHRAWQVGKQYDYKISGRTLAALHDVANQYNGVLLHARLRVQPEDEQTLNARVVEAMQAEVHQTLPGGWGSKIDESALSWKPLELTLEPFQIVMENGIVRRLIVSSKLPTSEVNLIKGLVSQLQVDTKGENKIGHKDYDLPAEDNPSGVYSVMEDAVTGRCEVQYDVSELPKYEVQSKPEIIPMAQLAKNGQVIDVVKTSNFSNCANRPEYHFGLNGLGKFKPASAKMGQFFARSSISRVVLTGNVNKYTIQSAVTTHKAIISPALYNTQKGMVVSRVNMTLSKIESAQGAPQAPSNPIAHQSLVYKYETEAMKKLSREVRQADDEESSVEVASAAKDFRKSLKKPSDNEQYEDASYEQAAHLPEDLDQSIDMLLHPNYAFPEAMDKQKVYTNIVELAKKIGQELQSAEAIQSEATLAKFNVLAALVRSARTSELKRVTKELRKDAEEEKTPAQIAAWKAYRDAVAEAGTGPALLTLKDWIMNDLVKGEEAAELIAALPRSARHPNNKYIEALFELATNQKVKQQQYLNTTAVLAFGDLVRLAQVDQRTMHNRYPSHVFGRLNPKESQAVVRDYIPYFKNALKKAVQNRDSHRIQTYTHVLGNIAHPKIVDVFEPYLSGKVHMTNYQRQAMVHALEMLVETNPRIARATLLKIYQNVADAPQVRAIAVIYLMKTNPPASLLQRMAESVEHEQNPHIRSIVKTAIQTAAQLNAWDDWELKTHAKSAEAMLNQTDINAHLSLLRVKSNDVKNTPLSYFASYATIGSQDSLLPRTIFMKLRQNLADLKLELQGFGVMTSSIEEIINSIGNKFEASKAWTKKHSTPYKTSQGWSIEDVLSEMNIARDHAEPIEANLLLRSLADKRFFTMDNQTIQQLPYEFQKVAEELRQGKNFNYTKMYNQYTVSMSFPTATGFPFFYSLSAPTLLSVGGQARVVMNPQPTADKIRIPETMNATLDIHLIASSKVQAQLGFVNPLTLNRYTAGLDKDMQIHVPVLAQVDAEVQKKQDNRQFVEIRTKIQPSESGESFPIVNLRSKPYLAKQSLLKAAPQEQHPISVRRPFETRFTVGQDLTGMAFRVEAASEMKFADFASLYKNAKKHDWISAITYFTNEDSIHNYNVKLNFDHEKSTAKSVELTAAIETSSKKTFDERDSYPKEEQDNLIQPLNAQVLRTTVSAAPEDVADSMVTPKTFKATPTNPARNPAKPQDKSANSQERRTEFLKKTSKTIQDADAVVVDLSAVFKGKSRAEFVATAAAAQSEVSDNTRVLLYLRKKSADQKEQQFAMAAESDVPRVPLSNFVSALKAQPDILVMTAIAYGEEIDASASQVDAVAFLHRSKSQREYVRKSAMGKLCVEQMHKGNNHLPACQNATMEASKLNSYYLDIAYDRISEQVKNATYKAYSLARDFGWEFNTENVIGVQNQPKKIHLKARFEPQYQAVNVSIAAPHFNSHFENVRLNRWVRAAAVVHPTFSPVSMLAREALHREHYPQCNVGQSAVNTFSNKTFPVKMGRNWHAVLVSAYKKNSASQKYEDLVVLARDTTSAEHQKEAIVLAGPNVIEVSHARDFARVNVNGKTIKISDKHTNVFSDGKDNAWAMIYGRPDGSVKIVLPIHKVKMLYDRTNLVISAGSQLRDQMRGLCGKFNDINADDFTVPRNCVVKHPQDLAASYIIKPTGNAVNEKQQAKEAHCIPKKYDFGAELRQSDDDSAEYQETGRSAGCVSYKIKTVEREGKICFSRRPQPSCNSHCRPSQEIEKNLEFVCIADRDLAAQYQRQIKSGSVPSLLQHGRSSATKNLSVMIPESCQM